MKDWRGKGFLKKALPAPSKPPPPLPKTFEWWGGYAAGVRSGGKPGFLKDTAMLL